MVSLLPGGRDIFAGTSRSTPRDDFLASVQSLIQSASGSRSSLGFGLIPSLGGPRGNRGSGGAQAVLRNPGFFQALAGFDDGGDDGGGGQAQGSAQIDQIISGLTQTGRIQTGSAGTALASGIAGGGGNVTPSPSTPGGASKSGGGARGSTSISGSAISLLTPQEDENKRIKRPTLLGG